MTTAHDLKPPAWVRKRDGRLVPFDADKIARVLFAAAEDTGQPDAFHARELADGIVHFLASELDEPTPTTEQIGEVVTKVVRELGHPHLAETFADFARRRSRRTSHGVDQLTPLPRPSIQLALDSSLTQLQKDCLRQYTLQTVFTRELASAHRDELLTLMGLESPAELSAVLVLAPAALPNLLPLLEETSRRAGDWIVLDGPEFGLLPRNGKKLSRREMSERTGEWLRLLLLGLRLTGRRAIVNLNVSQPPAWADELADGPLFVGQGRIADNEQLPALACGLWEAARHAGAALRLDWHLAARDFEPAARETLLTLARTALAGEPVSFVFDRPRRPLSLAEGIDRRRPAVLLSVGLNLPRLATLVCEEGTEETARRERLLERLRSLARLALSAAIQKRTYLRQHAREKDWAQGFLLDRARLLVVPLGLERSVEQIRGERLSARRQSLDFGAQILDRLQEVLREEGRQAALECCLDAPTGIRLLPDGVDLPGTRIPGPTCWDTAVPVKSQLKTIGRLHASNGGGTGFAVLPVDPAPTVDQLADWLRWAWLQTDVTRLHWVRQPAAHRQLLFPDQGEQPSLVH